MEITPSKIVALCLVIIYAVAAIVSGGLAAIPGIAILLVPPLGLIIAGDKPWGFSMHGENVLISFCWALVSIGWGATSTNVFRKTARGNGSTAGLFLNG